jgi:hypothetical protein
MKDIKNKTTHAGIMASRTVDRWNAGRPFGYERPMLRAVKTERHKFGAGPAFRAPGVQDASRFSIGQVDIGGTTVRICGKRRNIRRNRISFVPCIPGYFRVFTDNGKKIVGPSKLAVHGKNFVRHPSGRQARFPA